MVSGINPALAPTPHSADQREAAFIELLAEAIVADIRRGGTPGGESDDDSDDGVSVAVSSDGDDRNETKRKRDYKP